MKKIFTLLLAVMASTLFCNATMVYGTCGDNLSWELNTLTGALVITGSGKMHDWNGDNPVPWYEYKYDIHTLTLPEFLTKIGDRAFYYCTALTSVSIPNYVDSIGNSAFEGCGFLSPVTIGNRVTHIGDRAFRDCSSLTSIVIPNSVTSMGEDVFEGCSNLSSITLGTGLTSIAGSTFGNCSSLGSITIPSNIKTIDHGAFAYCTNLHTVTMTDGVTFIGNDAFSNCTGLTSITIPNSMDSIGNHAFAGCTKLSSVALGNHVAKMGEFAFVYCHSLKSITIPNSVTSIGREAFYSCINLKSLAIGTGLTRLEIGIFSNCDSLISVTIPDNVISLESSAFGGCDNLKSITIGTGVRNIESGAFSWCDSLKAVYISDLEAWCKINFAEIANPLSHGANLYLNSELVTDLVIPASIDTIKNYAFYGCESMTSMTIHNNVKEIGEYAVGCRNLKSVVIGSGVENLKQWAFDNCDSLTSVTCYATNPPATYYSYSFDGFNQSACTLYVPQESVDAYKAASDWNEFGTILPIGSTIEVVTMNVDLTTATEIAYTACSATPSCAEGVLTVDYYAGGWEWAGVEFALDNITDVTNISFDYQGDGTSVVFYPYLRDSQGTRWTKGSYYLNFSSTEWQSETTYLPDSKLWDSADYAFGEKPFVQLGFIANPGAATNGTFKLRNVKIEYKQTALPTGINDVTSPTESKKILHNGQILILRGEKAYNAQGALVK